MTPTGTLRVTSRALHSLRVRRTPARFVSTSSRAVLPRQPVQPPGADTRRLSIAERRRQGGWIGESRPRRTQVSCGRIQQILDCVWIAQMRPASSASLAASSLTRADRMPGSTVLPAHPRTEPPSHRSFPRATVGPARACHRRFHPPSALRNIDGRSDVLQRVQDAQNAAIACTSGSFGSSLMLTGMAPF